MIFYKNRVDFGYVEMYGFPCTTGVMVGASTGLTKSKHMVF